MKLRGNKLKTTLLVAINAAILVTVFAFNNCSSEHQGSGSSVSPTQFGTCSLNDAEELFSITFHPFLVQHCSNCHIPGGTGKGGFASPGLAVAFQAFNLAGVSKVSEYAVNAAHQSPYSGPQHQEDIDRFNEIWALGLEELANCDRRVITEDFVGDPWEDIRVHSRSKAITPEIGGQPRAVRWSLQSDMLPPPEGVTWPNLPGAFFELTVRADIVGGTTSYLLTEPRIVYPNNNNNATDLCLESLRFYVNGKEIINETTFHYTQSCARGNQNTLISAGFMTALSSLRASDVLSFSIGEIEAVTLPPPPPTPTVGFATTTSTVAGETGFVDIEVTLNQPIEDFISVNFSVRDFNQVNTIGGVDAAKPRGFGSIVDVDGNTVPINYYDMDYKIDYVGNTILFEPNVQSKTLRVQIVEDSRDENDERFEIRLEEFTIGGRQVEITGDRLHTVNIPDNDAAPAFDAITYTNLMEAGGVFAQHCVRCHHTNTADAMGREYDMSTFEDLMARNRVIPGDGDNSVLFQRMNSFTPTVKPMPLDGLLPFTERLKVKAWIDSGALNN